jgi:hypothetical protein
VATAPEVPADEFFAGRPFARAVLERVEETLAGIGHYAMRVTKSQVAFRRTRSFAFLWVPAQYLARPTADVVLAIDLPRHDSSPRFKEVAHPSPRHWIHHLEILGLDDVDDEVAAWLREAADAAA